MAGADFSPLLTSRTQMIDAMAKGGKPKAEWRVGTEHEKHVYRKAPLAPVQYEGKDGIHALLAGIKMREGWEYFSDKGHPIGLRNTGPVGGISLEPGGQFELSGAPFADCNAIAAETAAHLAEVKALGDTLGLGFLGLGHDPLWPRADIPVMPKGRYKIMREYMPKVGGLGLDMMFRTCTVAERYIIEVPSVPTFSI